MVSGKQSSKLNCMCLSPDKEGSEETSRPMILSTSPKDSGVIWRTSNLLLLHKVEPLLWFRISRFKEFRNSNKATHLLLKSVLARTVCWGLESHPMTRWRSFSSQRCTSSSNSIVGEEPWNQKAGHITMLFSASSSLYFTKTASRSLQENPGSIPCIYVLNKDTCSMSICSVSKEQGLSWNIQTHNTRPLKYDSSCINAMSIPLTTVVLERIIESVILCCRFVRINKMVRTISPMGPSSICLSSDLAPRENVTWPMPLNGHHFILSRDAADHKSVPSTSRLHHRVPPCARTASTDQYWVPPSTKKDAETSVPSPPKGLKTRLPLSCRGQKPSAYSPPMPSLLVHCSTANPGFPCPGIPWWQPPWPSRYQQAWEWTHPQRMHPQAHQQPAEYLLNSPWRLGHPDSHCKRWSSSNPPEQPWHCLLA